MEVRAVSPEYAPKLRRCAVRTAIWGKRLSRRQAKYVIGDKK